jgi:hypothetical protein
MRLPRPWLLLTALWPEWRPRLASQHASGKPGARRADELLTVACLLVGNTTAIQAATHLRGTAVSSHNVSTLLVGLTRRCDGADVLHALIDVPLRPAGSCPARRVHGSGLSDQGRVGAGGDAFGGDTRRAFH